MNHRAPANPEVYLASVYVQSKPNSTVSRKCLCMPVRMIRGDCQRIHLQQQGLATRRAAESRLLDACELGKFPGFCEFSLVLAHSAVLRNPC